MVGCGFPESSTRQPAFCHEANGWSTDTITNYTVSLDLGPVDEESDLQPMLDCPRLPYDLVLEGEDASGAFHRFQFFLPGIDLDSLPEFTGAVDVETRFDPDRGYRQQQVVSSSGLEVLLIERNGIGASGSTGIRVQNGAFLGSSPTLPCGTVQKNSARFSLDETTVELRPQTGAALGELEVYNFDPLVFESGCGTTDALGSSLTWAAWTRR